MVNARSDMERAMRGVVILASLAALAGCGQSDYAKFKADYDLGYRDGTAAGYLNNCSDWKSAVGAQLGSAGYQEGYKDGRKLGELECKSEGEG